jgi:hypothetical protein
MQLTFIRGGVKNLTCGFDFCEDDEKNKHN